MGTLTIDAQVNGVDFPIGSAVVPQAFTSEVWFGGFFPEIHADIRNITVGTTGFGSSDVWQPVLDDLSEFDGVEVGSGATLSAAAGVLHADGTAECYGWKSVGTRYKLYVQFDLLRRTDDLDADYHDIAEPGGGASFTAFNGIFTRGTSWIFDSSYFGSFGTGTVPPADGTTWVTLGLLWDFGSPPFVGPTYFDGAPVHKAYS